MNVNENIGRFLPAASLLVFLLTLSLNAQIFFAQKPAVDLVRERIRLYQDGKEKEAVSVLKSATKKQGVRRSFQRTAGAFFIS
jgi:hypothetical protein